MTEQAITIRPISLEKKAISPEPRTDVRKKERPRLIKLVAMHFDNPKGSLPLTIVELAVMNNPSFLSIYQKHVAQRTKADILAGIKGEFGKEIWQR